MLNYGRPYRNKSFTKVDVAQAYVSVDDDFLRETVDPLISKSKSKAQNASCDKAKSSRDKSLERNSGIKFSILSAMKRTPRDLKKQSSSSTILDDIESKKYLHQPYLLFMIQVEFFTKI